MTIFKTASPPSASRTNATNASVAFCVMAPTVIDQSRSISAICCGKASSHASPAAPCSCALRRTLSGMANARAVMDGRSDTLDHGDFPVAAVVLDAGAVERHDLGALQDLRRQQPRIDAHAITRLVDGRPVRQTAADDAVMKFRAPHAAQIDGGVATDADLVQRIVGPEHAVAAA